MNLGGIESWLGENTGNLRRAIHRRHGLLRGHAAQSVVAHAVMEVLPRRSLQGDARQAVLAVVLKSLCEVFHVVLSRG